MTNDLIGVSDDAPALEIDGEKVPHRHFKFFTTILENDLDTACKMCGYSRSTYYRLSKKDWWNKLLETYIVSAQDKLTISLSSLVNDMAKTTEEIIKGTFAEPRLASAAVKAIENFQKIGLKRGNVVVTPMTHSMRDLYLQNTTVNYKEEININQQVKELAVHMTPEEAHEWALNGIIPDRIIDMAKEKAKRIKDESDKALPMPEIPENRE